MKDRRLHSKEIHKLFCLLLISLGVKFVIVEADEFDSISLNTGEWLNKIENDNAINSTDCNCGENSYRCTFEDGVKICDCHEMYAEVNGTCEISCFVEPCKNEGYCYRGVCLCEEGTSGLYCETTYNCTEFCGLSEGVRCDYKKNIPYCYCASLGEAFDNYNKACKRCRCGGDNFIEGSDCKFKLGKKDCTCQNGYAYNPIEDQCLDCTCGEYELYCTFDDIGNKTCSCETEYAQLDDTCQRCYCGKGSESCAFKNNVKTCECLSGYAENDNMCEDCRCGIGSYSCEFREGIKTCNCFSSYVHVNGSCEECNCGIGSSGCTVDSNGVKDCKCEDHYMQVGGVCKQCNCGERSSGCTVDSIGVKDCKCEDKYMQVDGVCIYCGCGKGSRGCAFENFIKYKCYCNDTYGDNNGTCEECNCGEGSSGCTFDSDGVKTCNCNDRYQQVDGVCEHCDCGGESYGCNFKTGVKTCWCPYGFSQVEGVCQREPVFKNYIFVYGVLCAGFFVVIVLLICIIFRLRKLSR